MKNETNKKQNTIKISDPSQVCFDQEHNPPMHMVYEPGTYRHTCPTCGNVKVFTVAGFR